MAEFTSKQRAAITEARKDFDRTGFPEKVARLNKMVEDEESFSKIDDFITGKDQAVTDQPPLSGKGSGKTAWQNYAKAVTDMDPETVDSMEKDDLISVLTDEGFIASEDEDE